MTNVKKLNNKELIQKLTFLVAEEKKNIAAQIVLLKEVRKRKMALEMGYSNLLEFCVGELGLTRDQALKRSQAAATVAKEPVFLDMLKKDETSVSSLSLIAPKLTEKTQEEIRAFVPCKTKREVEAFVSTLNRDGTREDRPQTIKVVLDVEPEVLEKLHRARKLLKKNKAHVSNEDILKEALDLLLDKKDPVRKAERAAKREAPKKSDAPVHTPKKRTRYIPMARRHDLYSGPTKQCDYMSPTGRQCQEKHGLEIDHIHMFSQGGTHSPENLRLLCPTHNKFLAEKALGYGFFNREAT